MKKINFLATFALLATALSAPLAAQAPQAIQLSGDVKAVEIVGDEDGISTTNLVDPTVIVPGDRLLFRTNYTNVSNETVTNFVVSNPLPKVVRLAPGEAENVEVSVDGGATYGALTDLSVSDEAGSERAASEADVTHMRWTLAEIEAGESGQIKFYAIVR